MPGAICSYTGAMCSYTCHNVHAVCVCVYASVKFERGELKKLRSHRPALGTLFLKMKLYAAKNEGYKQFENELLQITEQQDAFMKETEWLIAVSENMDKAEVFLFFIAYPCVCAGLWILDVFCCFTWNRSVLVF